MDRARELGLLAEGFTGRSEIRFLLWLSTHEGVSAVDLMDHFGLSAGRVSNLLKALEKKGYIKREQIEMDRRKVTITLTKDGRKMAEELNESLHHVFASFFELLGEEEAEKFLAFEKRILNMIQTGQLTLTPPRKI